MDAGTGEEDTIPDAGTIAGGDHVLPLLPVAFGLGTALNTIYGVGQAVDSYRYWNDYYKNTGYKPRYPFRAGQFDWMSDLGHSAYSVAYWTAETGRGYRRYRRGMR